MRAAEEVAPWLRRAILAYPVSISATVVARELGVTPYHVHDVRADR